MPRKPRFAPPNYALHITQRGNYRQPVFFTDEDRNRFLTLMDSPVRARHDQGRSKASISKGEQERGGREAVRTATKLSHGVTERYGAGY